MSSFTLGGSMQLVRIEQKDLREAVDQHRRISGEGFVRALELIILMSTALAIALNLQGRWPTYAIAVGCVVCIQVFLRRKRWSAWYHRNVRGYSLVVMGMTNTASLSYAIVPGNVFLQIPRHQLPGFKLSLGGWRNPSELFFYRKDGVSLSIVSHSVDHGWVALRDGAHNIVRFDFERVIYVLHACESGFCLTFDDLMFPSKRSQVSRPSFVTLLDHDNTRYTN